MGFLRADRLSLTEPSAKPGRVSFPEPLVVSLAQSSRRPLRPWLVSRPPPDPGPHDGTPPAHPAMLLLSQPRLRRRPANMETPACAWLDGLQTCWNTGRTNNRGILPVSINTNSGAGAFLLTTFVTGDAYPSVEAIRSSSGDRELYWEDWYTSDYNLTAGILPLGNEMMINWPVRADDPATAAGSYTVDVAVIDTDGYYKLGERVTYYTRSSKTTATPARSTPASSTSMTWAATPPSPQPPKTPSRSGGPSGPATGSPCRSTTTPAPRSTPPCQP